MSTILYSPLAPGAIVTEVTLNTRTNLVAVGTAAVGSDNVRNEAVDIDHIDGALLVKDMNEVDNGIVTVGTAYTADSGNPNDWDRANAQELNHGTGSRLLWPGGLTLADGDLFRLHFGVMTSFSTTPTNPPFQFAEEPCWMVWPQVATDAGLTTWTTLGNQTDFGVAGAVFTGAADEMPGTMVIPHGTTYRTLASWGGAPVEAWHMSSWWRHKRSQNYLHSGADLTIYAVRFMLFGVAHPRTAPHTFKGGAPGGSAWGAEILNVGAVDAVSMLMRSA